MTDSPSSQRSRKARSDRRIGIRLKLFFAVGAVVALTLAASAVAWFSYAAIEQQLVGITAASLPTMAAATALVREGAALDAVAPALAAARTQADRQALMHRANEHLAVLDDILTGLDGSGDFGPEIQAIRDRAAVLAEAMHRVDIMLESRLAAERRVEALVRDTAEKHDNLLDAVAPATAALTERFEVQVASVVDLAETQTDDLAVAASGLVEVFQLQSAVSAMTSALTRDVATNETGVDDQERAYRTAWSAVQPVVARAEERLGGTVVADLAGQLNALVDGDAGVFSLRRSLQVDNDSDAATDGTAPGDRLRNRIADALRLEHEILNELDIQVTRARGRIRIAVRRLQRDTKRSMDRLVSQQLAGLRDHLRLSAEANLIAGFLNQAANAVTEVDLREIEARFQATAEAVRSIAATSAAADQAGLHGPVEALIGTAQGEDGIFAVRDRLLVSEREMAALVETTQTEVDAFSATVSALVLAVEQRAEQAAGAAEAAIDTARVWLTGIAVVSLIGATLIVFFYVGRAITGRLSALAVAMRTIAGGQLEQPVPVGGTDEIGDMAEALLVFRDTAREVKEANDRAVAERDRASEERHRLRLELADGFESTVKGMVDTVTAAAAGVHDTAGALVQTAAASRAEAGSATTASEQAGSNVETVAAATEELSASIAEIGRQVQQSADIAAQAAKDAAATDSTVQGLDQAASKVGDIVGWINTIAGQTNLLALNATIEAARAGEAGKGFAVVANEVKSLAAQTAKATDEIAGQINGMQSATQDAVVAIRSIAQTIANINDITGSIAAAVHEQETVARDIAASVAHAADGTTRTIASIGTVRRTAAETGQSAEDLLSTSATLSDQANALTAAVQDFLKRIRTG